MTRSTLVGALLLAILFNMGLILLHVALGLGFFPALWLMLMLGAGGMSWVFQRWIISVPKVEQ